MSPARVRCVIIGAGFAGASTASALARAGFGPGLVLEREPMFGVHASGRNAGIVRLVDEDPLIRTLALRSLERLRTLQLEGAPVMRETGGLSLATRLQADALFERHTALLAAGLTTTAVLTAAQARARFPFLSVFDFDLALWCPAEGIVDIHALLTLYLQQARRMGFTFRPRCPVDGLIIEAGRVKGVCVAGEEIRAEIVVDATGAWAGRIGRPEPLPLRPLRRHLCVTGRTPGWDRDAPYVWMWSDEFYCRSEAGGLLMSPCDETASQAPPATDPAAIDLLADRLTRYAPGLLDLPLRRSWACLRTFTPDRRPFVGPDPALPGLYHVSGLGGFGMMTSAAIGEAAAAATGGRHLDWIDLRALSLTRVMPAPDAESTAVERA